MEGGCRNEGWFEVDPHHVLTGGSRNPGTVVLALWGPRMQPSEVGVLELFAKLSVALPISLQLAVDFEKQSFVNGL